MSRDEREEAQQLAREQGYAFADLERVVIDRTALDAIPKALVVEHRAIPIKREGNVLWVAMAHVNARTLDLFAKASGCKAIPVMALASAVQDSIAKHYPQEGVFRDPVLTQSFSDAQSALTRFMAAGACLSAADALVDRLESCYRANGKVLIAGNGGSMADSMHFAEEWTGRFRNNRRPLPAMALADPTHLTCVANDFGYEHVFSRMVEAFAKPEDVVILLSTSGNSPNLLLAAHAAKKAGAVVVGLLGRDGGKLAPLCDLCLVSPGERSDRIQELHMLTLHAVIDAVEHRLGIA